MYPMVEGFERVAAGTNCRINLVGQVFVIGPAFDMARTHDAFDHDLFPRFYRQMVGDD